MKATRAVLLAAAGMIVTGCASVEMPVDGGR